MDNCAPGTWQIHGDSVVSVDHSVWYEVARVNNPKFTDEANATHRRLIAAALDMHDLLEAAVRRVEMANIEGNQILSAWLPDARAILAKVQGTRPEEAQSNKRVQDLQPQGTDSPSDLIYLTNSEGEPTGLGSVELTEDLLAKLEFLEGPGDLFTYFAEIDGEAFILGVRELYFDAPMWDANKYQPYEAVEEAATNAARKIRSRISRIIPDSVVWAEAGNSRFEVAVAIPVNRLEDRFDTRQMLSVAFGSLLYEGEGKSPNLDTELPQHLYVVDVGSNGAAPSGCEVVLDDVEGGNPERDYFLVSVINGDPDLLKLMARRLALAWEHVRGISTQRLESRLAGPENVLA